MDSVNEKGGQKEQAAAAAVDFLRTCVVSDSLSVLRAAGRGAVRRRLETLVNEGILGVGGAQKIYKDAFGGELKAVKDHSKKSDLSRWFRASTKGRERAL
jgi:hypothetical protein